MKSRTRKIIGYTLLALILAGIIAAAIYLIPALSNPASVFDSPSTSVAKEASAAPGSIAVITVNPLNTEHEESKQSEEQKVENENLEEVAEPSPMEEPEVTLDGVINIMLLGLDNDYKYYAENGGDVHTDAMIVLKVDFNNNTATMISLPRDTFTTIPGTRGYYKLNAAINIGGGKTEEGFRKVCETASSLLGNVPVDYYVAFEFSTVKEVCNSIGGVDYDLEFTYVGPSGREYEKGYQHLDGVGIYDYLRARRTAPSPFNQDKYRMERCRKMMLAVFDKMKKENMLGKIPEILETVSGGLYTNLTARQIIALSNFAMSKLNTKDIESYQLQADKTQIILGWKFTFLWDRSRINLVRDVYGVEAQPRTCYTLEFAKWLNKDGFLCLRYIGAAKQVIEVAEGMELNDEQRKALDSLREQMEALQQEFDVVAATLKDSQIIQLRKDRSNLKKVTEQFATLIGYQEKLNWTVSKEWYKDTAINEVTVVFS